MRKENQQAGTDEPGQNPADAATWSAVRPFFGPWATFAVAYVLFDELPGTADRVTVTWLNAIALAIPLQLMLGVAAVVIGASTRGPRWRRIARSFAWTTTALMLVHIVITLATL